MMREPLTIGSLIEYAAVHYGEVMVLKMPLQVIDQAVRVRGGGIREDFGLDHSWVHAHSLRHADCPDEILGSAIAKLELRKQNRARLHPADSPVA